MKPLEIVRDDRGFIKSIGDLCVNGHYRVDDWLQVTEELAREFAVTLLRKECIRLWRVVWESDGESNNGNLDTFQRAAKLREAQMAWERVVDLEAKIERYLRTGEWSE